MRRRFLFYSLLTVCLLTACAEEEQNPLPYVRVDFSVSKFHPALMNGLSARVQEGYSGYNRHGVIIVPPVFGSDYLAFDATCTRNIKEELAAINVDGGGFTATCPKCNTVYNLLTGYAQNQTFHLQRYKAYESNDRIYVTN